IGGGADGDGVAVVVGEDRRGHSGVDVGEVGSGQVQTIQGVAGGGDGGQRQGSAAAAARVGEDKAAAGDRVGEQRVADVNGHVGVVHGEVHVIQAALEGGDVAAKDAERTAGSVGLNAFGSAAVDE